MEVVVLNCCVDEHPTMLFVYKLDQATILCGLPPEVEDFRWVPINISSKKELDDFIAKYHWDREVKVLMVPVEFARMLAKIAYSFIVGELGLDSFRPLPQTLDIILDRTSNVSYLVEATGNCPNLILKACTFLLRVCASSLGAH
jgi:hypothetical protein